MPIAWIYGLIGGLLIGSAGALYLLGVGRVMGASGIIGGLVERSEGHARTALPFVAGVIAVPVLLTWGGWRVDTHATDAWPLLTLGGLAVGLGTRLANGCTSGHGVCGISRLSPRGIVATLCYIGAGAATVAALRVGLGL